MASREWPGVELLRICSTTFSICYTTNPQQVEVMEFGL